MKLRKNKTITAGVILILIMALFSACASGGEETQAASTTIPIQNYSYSAKDLNDQYDESEATGQAHLDDDKTVVTGSGLSYENGVLTIDTAGTYILSGTLTDGQILVSAGEKDDVQIVLNGVNITNKTAPAFYEKTGDKTILTLAKGSKNTFADGKTYEDTGDSAPDATIYATHDLSINGEGELVVDGNYTDGNGIGSQDDLAIVGSSLNVTASNNAIKGRDVLAIKDANITVKSQNDGLKSNNDTDNTKGYIQIDSGILNISAADDGIKAETNLIINGGTINITESTEGIEATAAVINDGNIDIVASNDGINASSDANNETSIKVNGGTINIVTNGDGLDSNGDIYIEDGEIAISGPTDGPECPLDVVGKLYINGGTISTSGNTSMPVVPAEDSKQASLMIQLSAVTEKGDTIAVKDSSGKTVSEHTPENDYQLVMFSSAALKDGETYSIYSGKKELTTVTLSGSTTAIDENGDAVEINNMAEPGQGGQDRQNGQDENRTPPDNNGQPPANDGGQPAQNENTQDSET